ncbi:hypothetical protein M407DRAFT_15839 [Tulasnella calospora MUT 4182]|uniref:GRIP domain-containing protein n=1 Tax=Tulasnella calospora MUT 4182 TaxID=1051891 RepID=A0A0C3KIC3_9AGAM|nr:hypothetical protein M407DRAFT_15839 [Tulasnella calospora MUT 4182]
MASQTQPQDGGASDGMAGLRLSTDSNDRDTNDEPTNDVEKLQLELERTRAEKDVLADQYNGLLAKLTTMRNTLGNKLREDAEELDRREQLIQQFTTQNEELNVSVTTLRDELVLASNESAKLSEELSLIRSRAVEESAHEASIREGQILELQNELEICRTERDEWERVAQQESMAADEARSLLDSARREWEIEEAQREKDAQDLAMEKEKSANLQSVLEDFQAAKDAEIRSALADYELQILQTTQSLAEFKSRALSAEAELSEVGSNAGRLAEVEQELKDKAALIAKLRHENVIANEHLTEALRRLRKNASDENVDRRLVTNVILSYLTTARGDSKRFEMLSLLASILSWSDAERETAGLQKQSAAAKQQAPLGRKSSAAMGGRPSPLEVPKQEESESFSKLWVEFLLKESTQGTPEPSSAATPRQPTNPSSPSGNWSPVGTRSPVMSRLPSLSSGNASSRASPGRDRSSTTGH